MNTDRIAPFYRSLEAVAAGDKLQRCRTAFLEEIPAPRRVLLAGEGHGRFLPECVRLFPNAEIVVVDSSKPMLEIARNIANSPQIDFIHADVLDWEPTRPDFDLIVTHFFLDCFTREQIPGLVAKLGQLACPGADWLLADFEIPAAGLSRLRAKLILATLYRFFQMTSGLRASELTPPDTALQNAGFTRKRRVTFEWGLLKSEWWARDAATPALRLPQSDCRVMNPP